MRILTLLLAAALLIWAPEPSEGWPQSLNGFLPTWDFSAPPTYIVDTKAAGPFSDDDIAVSIKLAFDQWTTTTTAEVAFVDGGRFTPAIATRVEWDSFSQTPTGPSAIVFDPTGQISDSQLLTGIPLVPLPRTLIAETSVRSSSPDRISRFAILLGPLAFQGSINYFRSIVLHEIGHGLNLDHQQIGGNGLSYPGRASPVMFPVAGREPARLFLHPSDVASLSESYPSSTYEGSFGHITGVLLADGRPLSGVNVVAEAVDIVGSNDPRDVELNLYACVSGYSGVPDGTFELSVLPGTYRLWAESVNPSFNGPSSVGPYAQDPRAPSFQIGTVRQVLGTVTVAAGEFQQVQFTVLP